MYTSVNNGESYPGCDFTITQLLYAVKRKLWCSAFGGRVLTTMNQIEVDLLERDASEALALVRSMKNKFAPINRIPSDVFPLIPGYLKGRDMDRGLITMTHVCRCWRELLIARPSLWAHLDCANTDKTQVYIERSRLSPLALSLYGYMDTAFLEDAFLLVVPHLSQLRSFTIDGLGDNLQVLMPHLSCPAPLLRELTIDLCFSSDIVLGSALFNGDLSLLCSLYMTGVIAHLPWRNMSKLTTFTLCRVLAHKITITQFLNFFEDAHHLRDITLRYSIPTSSNASPERVVSLPHLEKLTIEANSVHSILLNHLSIPTRASLTLGFDFAGDKSLISDFLPKTLKNLGNIFPSSSINLTLHKLEKYVRLGGPNGELYMLGQWMNGEGGDVFALDH